MTTGRDHGGGLDAAITQYGGDRDAWIDLSTGINPTPYPIPTIRPDAWTSLPDQQAIAALELAGRHFWNVPDDLEIVAAGGASALIAAMPRILKGQTFNIPSPTYNEHRAAFEANGWEDATRSCDVNVIVHPNNPDGRFGGLLENSGDLHQIIDESFCDVAPERSLLQVYSPSRVAMENKNKPTTYTKNPPIILKSFGKFWGLAGLRLGFAICSPQVARKLRDQLGPWAVSGPACQIGSAALNDLEWAQNTRVQLNKSAKRLDKLLKSAGFEQSGGTDLFRLVSVNDAALTQDHLAKHQILTRIFPYSKTWVRFGLPGPEDDWTRLETALKAHP